VLAALGRTRSSGSVTTPAGEVLVDLVVQVLAVGDDHEGPVAGQLAQHLLGEEDHRVALAAALGVPEDAQLALVLADLLPWPRRRC
jgi:hypothetical protein